MTGPDVQTALDAIDKCDLDVHLRAALRKIARTDPGRAIDLADRWERDERRERRQPVRIQFASRLRELIAYHELKQRDVADLLGLGENGHKVISRYVTAGHNPHGRMPEIPDLVKLAEALGVSTAYFLDANPPELDQLRRGELAGLRGGEPE